MIVDQENLRRRLTAMEPSLFEYVFHVIDRYTPEINIRNLMTGDLILLDNKNRSIGFSMADKISDSVFRLRNKPQSELVVVATESSLLGWIKTSDAQPEFSSSLIAPLPEDFNFKIECPHLNTYGGWTTDYDHWECLGCGKELVFSDKKR